MSDIDELRGWLAARLNRDAVPGPVWNLLWYQGHIADVLEDRITREQLVVYARALHFCSDTVERVESLSETDTGGLTVELPQFSGYEKERAETLAQYLAMRATVHPGVQAFRRDVLGGELLSPERAYELAQDWAQPEESPQYPSTFTFRETFPGGDNLLDIDDPGARLEIFKPDTGEYEPLGYRPESILERLHNLVRELIGQLCPPWKEGEAVWFVLTGEVPVARALVGEANTFVGVYPHLTYGEITLTVEPWVATETVAKAYHYLQMQLMRRQPGALSQRNLAVARFVMGELKALVSAEPGEKSQPQRLSWRTLMERWNRLNRDLAYQDERLFRRDFYRAARAVVRPYELGELTAWISIP